MKRNILGLLSCLVLLSTAQAETSKESCLFHSWKGTIGNTSVFMEFDDYLYGSHYHVGRYYAFPSMEPYGLSDIQNQSRNSKGTISEWPANDNQVDKWQEGKNKMNPKLGRKTYAYTGALILNCSGNTMSGQWESLDGKKILPIQAEIVKASFDCAKASSNIEKTICNNPILSALDSKLDIFYKAALTKYSTTETGLLKEDQKNWLKKARGICDAESCLKKIYEFRIYELSRLDHFHKFQIPDTPIDGGNHPAVRIASHNERNQSFNSILRAMKLGNITQCNFLIDVPGGRNHSYGGICTLSKNGHKSKVMVCNDEMVGHFKMDNMDHEVTPQELVNYVASNCYGG
ncbi:MAG: hypothetical protein Q7T38_10735 [Gallionella sp.]|nr:hypothetical protein [Gallionella sp.]